jgi:TonB-dependent receptor
MIRTTTRFGAYLAALLISVGITSTAFAQTGSISGTLVDSETGETLIGANIVIEGTTIGTTTDLDGNYTIRGVEPGSYGLVFSYIGYSPKTVTGVEVQADQSTTIDLALSPEAIGLDEVVVEAQALENTEAALLRQRQKASAVSDAISAEMISRSGSGDAAAAMTKVTGASVMDGKYVYIRGLGDRYSSTTLNGSVLPSADPDRKAFQFDLFPSNLLENIVTLKTFTPDKPGSFSGGLVDVGTKSFPENFTLQFSASTSYDTEASFSDDFIAIPGGGINWLGFANGEFELPAALADRNLRVPTEQDARDFRSGETNASRAAAADSLDRFSRAFNSMMGPDRLSAPINRSYSGSIGGQASLFGRPIGYTGSLTYSRDYSSYDSGVFGRWDLTGATFDDATSLTPEVYYAGALETALIPGVDTLEIGNFVNQNGTEETNWGASGTLSYRPHPNHMVETTLLRTQSATSEASLLAGFRDQTRSSTFVTRTLHYTERALLTTQLHGEHHFAGIDVEWTGSNGQNEQNEPDLRYFSNVINVREHSGGLDTLYFLPGANEAHPTRYFRNLDEDNRTLQLDVSVPFPQWAGLSSRFKFGGALDDADRTFRQRRFQYHEGRGINFQDFRGDFQSYFDQAGVADTITVNETEYFAFGPYISETSPARSNYDAARTLAAGYAMVELPVTRDFRVIGGARLESTYIETVSQDASLPDSIRFGVLDNLDVLPSLNLVYEAGENMNVRAAVTRTLARPTFRELAPYQSFDFVGGYVFEGNPAVERTLITNYDLRWEWFMRPGEIAAVSGFYKSFDRPIERVIRAQGEGKLTTVRNVPSAQVYGVEFEARKRLGDLIGAPLFRNLSIGGNLSIVQSIVDIPDEEYQLILASHPTADDTRPLEGQSPYLLNLNLSYENLAFGTAAGLYYNLFGERLVTVTNGAAPDVYEKARGDLDFTLAQELMQGFRLKASAKNILGAPMEQVQIFKDQEYTYFSYDRARTLSLGVTYEIN